MTLIEEVLTFARSYINNRWYRTKENKTKIREALIQLTGEKINFGCSTCYIEALFKIINISKMATSRYELKRGVLLQASGHPDKACTNDTLTDELAEWHLHHHPECVVYFSRLPAGYNAGVPSAVKVLPPVINIVPPEKIVIPVQKPEKSVQETAQALIETVQVQKPVKKVVHKPSKTKK